MTVVSDFEAEGSEVLDGGKVEKIPRNLSFGNYAFQNKEF